ncbi:MAG: hypothetical protein WHV64_02165 [Geminicoccaceae bacterium]
MFNVEEQRLDEPGRRIAEEPLPNTVGVPVLVVGRLVGEQERELRLVLHAQQGTGPDLDDAVRPSPCAETRSVDDVEAELGAALRDHPTQDAPSIGFEIRLLDDPAGAPRASFLPIRREPHVAFRLRGLVRAGARGQSEQEQRGAGIAITSGPRSE